MKLSSFVFPTVFLGFVEARSGSGFRDFSRSSYQCLVSKAGGVFENPRPGNVSRSLLDPDQNKTLLRGLSHGPGPGPRA